MTTKGNPIPVRFDLEDEAKLKELARASGFSVRALIRSAVRYAMPRFASGEANILTPNTEDLPSSAGAVLLAAAKPAKPEADASSLSPV